MFFLSNRTCRTELSRFGKLPFPKSADSQFLKTADCDYSEICQNKVTAYTLSYFWNLFTLPYFINFSTSLYTSVLNPPGIRSPRSRIILAFSIATLTLGIKTDALGLLV